MHNDHLTKINYDKIVNDHTLCIITRLTALNLRINPYMTIGDFFDRLTRRELYELLDMVRLSEKGDLTVTEDLLLLCEMLANAEGVFSSSLDELNLNLKMFCVMVRSVVLHVKGELVVNFDNLTFGTEYHATKPFIHRNT